MEHLGIDLGQRTTNVCRVSARGQTTWEGSLATAALTGWLAERKRARVILESSSESRVIAMRAKELGHEVCVVPTALVRTLGVGARGIKTDRRDARALALASFRLGDQLPQTHVKSDKSAELLTLLNSRANLIEIRTKAVNFVRSVTRARVLPRLRCTPERFADVMRATYPELADETAISAPLAMLETLNTQIDRLDEQIRSLAQSDESVVRLMKITGVGPIVATAFIAVIDDPQRFESGRSVASYLGLSPGERTTGGRIHRTGAIAAGQTQLRGLLVQAAHAMMRARRVREPMAIWADGLAKRKGKRIAVVALARRLAKVMWAMLRDAAEYDPKATRPKRPQNDTSSALKEALST